MDILSLFIFFILMVESLGSATLDTLRPDEKEIFRDTTESLASLKSDIELSNPQLDAALDAYNGSGSLDLSGKDITSGQLESAWEKLAACKNLQRIDLSHNLLEDLGTLNKRAFPGLTSLKHLDLSDNRLIELDGMNFDPKVAANIERLYINDNAYISDGGDRYAFSLMRNLDAFSHLKHLSAEHNALTSESFLHYNDKKTKLPALESLFLKGNDIVNFDRLHFFPSLHVLDMRENKIVNLSMLEGSYKDLALGVLTNVGFSFAGIKNSNLKKLYLDARIVDDLPYFASHIDGGDELLQMVDKKGLIIADSGL